MHHIQTFIEKTQQKQQKKLYNYNYIRSSMMIGQRLPPALYKKLFVIIQGIIIISRKFIMNKCMEE